MIAWIFRILVALILIIFIATYAFGEEYDSFNPMDRFINEKVVEKPAPKSTPQINRGGLVTIPVSMLPRTSGKLFEKKILKQNTSAYGGEGIAKPLNNPSPATGLGDGLPPEAEAALKEILADIEQNNPENVTPKNNIHTPVVEGENLLAPTKIQTKIVEETPGIPGEGYGVLTESTGGFSASLWQGIDFKRVDILLSRIEEKGIKSRVSLKLLQRLLLTEALPPKAIDNKKSWLTRRVVTLQQMGLVSGAGKLLSGFTNGYGLETHAGMAELWVENNLLAGNIKGACTFAKEHILNNDSPFWRRAIMACQAMHGDMQGLELSMELAKSDDSSASPLLFRLLSAIKEKEGSPRLTAGASIEPLVAALYVQYTEMLTPDVIPRLSDTSLYILSRDSGLSLSLRIQAAEQLINNYPVDKDKSRILAGLYDTVKFDKTVFAAPLKNAKAETDGSLARALLWQAARQVGLTSKRAMALKAMWERAEEDNLLNIAAVLTPDSRGIRPTANLAWFAPDVIYSSLKGGNLEVATSWWKVLKGNNSLSTKLEEKRAELAVIFSLYKGKAEKDVMKNWWEVNRVEYDESAQQDLQRTLMLMEASGIEVPVEIWHSLHNTYDDAYTRQGPQPGPMWLRLLGASLENHNVGEAVLILTEPLMYSEPSELAPMGISNIVSGMRFLGLEKEATGLALEAILEQKL